MLDALASRAPVIVYVDIKSPYAFVAIKPTLALEAQLGVQFDWRPLTLDIPSYLGSAKKSAGKVVQSNRSADQWLSVKYGYKDARRYAEQQGYMLKGTEKIWDSSLANMGISWTMRSRIATSWRAILRQFTHRSGGGNWILKTCTSWHSVCKMPASTATGLTLTYRVRVASTMTLYRRNCTTVAFTACQPTYLIIKYCLAANICR